MASLIRNTSGDERRDDPPGANLRKGAPGRARIMRWVAVPGVGAALGLWLVGTMAGLSSVGASLSSASGGLPQTLSMTGSIALADPLKQHLLSSSAPFASGNSHGGMLAMRDHAVQCGLGCFTPVSAHDKTARLVALNATAPAAAKPTARERFESIEASLSPARIAAALAGKPGPAGARPVISAVQPGTVTVASLAPTGTLVASLSEQPSTPSAERFARAEESSPVVQTAPQPMRFGHAGADPASPSPAELALALVKSMPVDDQAFSDPLPITESSADVAVAPAQAEVPKPGDAAAMPDALTNDVPLPTWRPKADSAATAKAEQAPQPKIEQARPARQTRPVEQSRPVQTAKPEQPATPRGRSGESGEMLAYARPDMPSGGLGQAFKNLFSTPRPGGAGNGVAVYDISAKTVYMPDGQRLEAHSGLGAFVDQPRYVDQKDRGPTPPNTYKLSLRESRFHGVEALRLTPVGGGNKYGRDGLLAHTYMLRGGRAESNGCVVFRDYSRFLAAFKRGKITHLVVVPRLSGSPARVASNARGA